MPDIPESIVLLRLALTTLYDEYVAQLRQWESAGRPAVRELTAFVDIAQKAFIVADNWCRQFSPKVSIVTHDLSNFSVEIVRNWRYSTSPVGQYRLTFSDRSGYVNELVIVVNNRDEFYPPTIWKRELKWHCHDIPHRNSFYRCVTKEVIYDDNPTSAL